ncbi:MAG: hypothetical protein KJO42_11060 [Silicimonas sp.]|nr:hypothetical protein [Silicimonas sp.]NNL72662.1 hypothetical protein [Silicimonas sp.]
MIFMNHVPSICAGRRFAKAHQHLSDLKTSCVTQSGKAEKLEMGLA